MPMSRMVVMIVLGPVLMSTASAQQTRQAPRQVVPERVTIGAGTVDSCHFGYEQVLRNGRLVWRQLVMCPIDAAGP